MSLFPRKASPRRVPPDPCARAAFFDVAFTSVLSRAQRTLDLAYSKKWARQTSPSSKIRRSIERDYGDLSGLNKDNERKKWGEEQVHVWRRSYDMQQPGGENLSEYTAARVLPYYIQEILPRVLRGDNVIVVAHGNSLRALVMVLERLSPTEIVGREIATGVPLIYRLNADSTVAEKKDLAA